MRANELKNILEILTMMKEAELKLAVLYETCAVAFPESSDFWLNISSEEKKHAGQVDTMMSLVSAAPESFTVGQPFNINAIKTFVQGIVNNIRRISERELSIDQALFIARDTENSVIEARFFNIVKTALPEYLVLTKEIIQDTFRHRGLLEAKISSVRKT